MLLSSLGPMIFFSGPKKPRDTLDSNISSEYGIVSVSFVVRGQFVLFLKF